MKKVLNYIACALFACVLALGVVGITGCSSESSNAPTDITYDVSTGDFSFTTVDGGDTYVVGVMRVLNDVTGEALTSINGSSTVEVDGVTYYVWSEQTGSVSGLSDSDGDGTITGTVVYREYSSSAETVGAVFDASELGVGTYILAVTPASTDELTDPEVGYLVFTVEGTLETPSGFTAQVNSDGYIEVTAESSYFLNCLTDTGLPSYLTYEVYADGELVETITVDDYSYTNTVLGPAKSFTFTNAATVTGTVALDTSAEITVTVTAVSEYDGVESASAEAYVATTTEAPTLASTYDITASGTCGDYTVSVTFGTDASGNDIYVLSASVNSVVIYYETGTVSASEAAGTYEEKSTYPADATLTLTTTSTDAASGILDGVTLTVVSTYSEGNAWMGTEAGYTFTASGSASIDGVSFDLA